MNLFNFLKENNYKWVVKLTNKRFTASKDEILTNDSIFQDYIMEKGERLPIKKMELVKVLYE